jgi:hypothetical protein
MGSVGAGGRELHLPGIAAGDPKDESDRPQPPQLLGRLGCGVTPGSSSASAGVLPKRRGQYFASR